MKFTCKTRELSKACQTVSKAAATRATVPALEGIKIEVKDDRIRLCGYNLELGITTALQTDGDAEDGTTVLDAKTLCSIMKKLPDANTTIEILDPMDGQAILKKIELCARVSHKSEDRITETSAAPFVKSIIELGDESVLEHYSITVKFICDRGISHELVRHRIAAFTQESTRYCNYSKDGFGNEITVILPPFCGALGIWVTDSHNFKPQMQGVSRAELEWLNAMKDAEIHYFALLKNGFTPEEARSALPNSLKTEVICTANLREWRHILSLRADKRAHPQMRQLMIPLLYELQEKIPVVFDDIAERIRKQNETDL